MNTTTRRNNSGGFKASGTAPAPFCKVCYDAGLPTDAFTSHFVKDQPGPNGKVVCPTLLAQKCLICGIPGHTSSYCRDSRENYSVSSSSSLLSTSSTISGSRYAAATDDVVRRLPPLRSVPRIVYPTLQNQNHQNKTQNQNLFNDFPALSTEPPMFNASPVHSPLHSPVKYNKKNNRFGDLDNSDDSDCCHRRRHDKRPPTPKKNLQEKSSSSSSWASVVSKSNPGQQLQQQPQQPQQRARSRFSIVIPTAISTGSVPLLPPIVFKAKPNTKSDAAVSETKKKEKKSWGDTDSEDDEEFLKRGLE